MGYNTQLCKQERKREKKISFCPCLRTTPVLLAHKSGLVPRGMSGKQAKIVNGERRENIWLLDTLGT